MKLFRNQQFILFLILLNSLIIFIDGFTFTPEIHKYIGILDNLITISFVLELISKLKYSGFRKYFSLGWNIFDFILVIVSVPSLIIYLFNIEMIDLSFILIFRVLRIFKTFRFLRFIPNIEELINGIKKALSTFPFILIGFIVYVFVIGILSFYIFKNVSTEYFGDPILSLYSIFKIFTIEGWFSIPESISQNYGIIGAFFTHLYFIFILLTGGIIGLSLINSIFIDAMLRDNNDHLENKIDELSNKIDILIKNANKS